MPSQSKSSVAEALSRFRAQFTHAFAMPKQDDLLSVEEVALLDRMAETVVRRGMAAPATLFLESVAPMNFLGSQLLHALVPLLNLACDSKDWDRAARLLECRGTLGRLAAMIEAKSTAASTR
jgi:hypothetical protein